MTLTSRQHMRSMLIKCSPKSTLSPWSRSVWSMERSISKERDRNVLAWWSVYGTIFPVRSSLEVTYLSGKTLTCTQMRSLGNTAKWSWLKITESKNHLRSVPVADLGDGEVLQPPTWVGTLVTFGLCQFMTLVRVRGCHSVNQGHGGPQRFLETPNSVPVLSTHWTVLTRRVLARSHSPVERKTSFFSALQCVSRAWVLWKSVKEPGSCEPLVNIANSHLNFPVWRHTFSQLVCVNFLNKGPGANK